MSDEETPRVVEYARIDPVEAFEQTIHDVMQVVDLFKQVDSPMTPMEFLQAAYAAEERLKALTTFTMAGVTGGVRDKIPPEVQAQFQSQRDLDDLMTSPEEKHSRMIKALRGIATSWGKLPPAA